MQNQTDTHNVSPRSTPRVIVRRDRLARLRVANYRVYLAVLKLASTIGIDLIDELITHGEKVIAQPATDLSALRQQMTEAGQTADEALAHLKTQTSAAGIGADIKRMLGQEEDESPPRQWTAEEIKRGYEAAMRPDPINRKSLHNYEFRVRYGGV